MLTKLLKHLYITYIRRVPLRDAAFVAGLGLLGVGLWLIYPPVSLTVAGLVLLAGAMVGHFRDAP